MSSATESPLAIINARLKQLVERIEMLLPEFMKGQAPRLTARALEYFRRGDWKLQQCTPESFVQCVLQAAELGFAIDGVLCYAVPFNTKAKKQNPQEQDRWEHKAQLIPSYKGLIAVAKRGRLISDAWARVVTHSDFFAMVEKDGVTKYEYQQDLDASHDRSDNMKGVLAVATHRDGWYRSEWMPAVDIESIRNRSKASKDGPWVTDPGEMSKKTALKRLLKTFSDDPGLLLALQIDDQADIVDVASAAAETQQERARQVIPALAHQPAEVAFPTPQREEVNVEVNREAIEPEPLKQPLPEHVATEAEIVQGYKDRIEACTSGKDANGLVTLAKNDMLAAKVCSPEALDYIQQLCIGNQTAWRQKKGGPT